MPPTLPSTSTTIRQPPIAEVDFAQYRRPELAEQIAELVSVPATIGMLLKWASLIVVITWVGLPMLFADRIHWTLLGATMVYGTVAAVIVGLLLGIVAKLARSLDDLSEIVIASIEVAEQVSADVAAMRDGTTVIPTGEQTLVGVYDNVIMPAVKAAATRNTWVIGQLAYWIHCWTLNRILKRVIRAVGRSKQSAQVSGTIENIDGAAERAADWLRRSHTYLDGIGNGIRRTVGFPVVVLMSVFFVLLAMPLVIVWWLT